MRFNAWIVLNKKLFIELWAHLQESLPGQIQVVFLYSLKYIYRQRQRQREKES